MKNDFEVRGNVTAIILRSRDGRVYETLIDTDALDIAAAHPNTWRPHTASNGSVYVYGQEQSTGGPRKTLQLHRLAISAIDGINVDHINHDSLDNRRANLRMCTQVLNSLNSRGVRADSKTGIRGITPIRSKWTARIQYRGVQRYLGIYDTQAEAQAVYQAAYEEVMTKAERDDVITPNHANARLSQTTRTVRRLRAA